MMISARKFFYIIIFLALIFSVLIWHIYFWPQEAEPALPKAPSDTTPAEVTFEPEKVPVNPPDYEIMIENPASRERGNTEDQNERASSSPEAQANSPEEQIISSFKVVGYRGVITKISADSIKFVSSWEGEEIEVVAAITAQTRFTETALSDQAERKIISLHDLSAGDEILVSGLAADYNQPILVTDRIEKFYFKK